MTELYGYEHSGKSTFALFLLGCVRKDGVVGIMDLETSIDPEYVPIATGQSGFKGTIKTIDYAIMKKKKKVERYHEDMAKEAAEMLLDEDVNGFMLDSLGMWKSQEEMDGEIGDSNWGKRAKGVGQWSRKCLGYLRLADNPKVVIAVNHAHPVMGGRGHYTPGGVTKGFAAGQRLFMFRKDSKSFEGGAFQAEIVVEKLRYGGAHKERTGIVFIIPNLGVSPEMTAVLDCVRLELAERGNTVKLKGQSIGKLNTLLKWAVKGETHKFKPFFDALAEYKEEG
jgi:RecA/RadA recombinase